MKIRFWKNKNEIECRATQPQKGSPFVVIMPTQIKALWCMCQWLGEEGYDLRDYNLDETIREEWKEEEDVQ